MKLALEGPQTVYAFVRAGDQTHGLVPNGSVEFKCCETIKVAVFDVKTGRSECVGARFLSVHPTPGATGVIAFRKGVKLGFQHAIVVDHTDEMVSAANADAEAEAKSFSQWLANIIRANRLKSRNKLDVGLIHRSMVEADLPSNMRVSMTSGIPTIRDGLREYTPDDAMRAFSQCMQLATTAMSFNARCVETAAQQIHVCEMLYVAALRIFGGIYHKKKETVDDRTMPSIQLYSNGDCDDAALAGCALATKLSEYVYTPTPGQPYAPSSVLAAVGTVTACMAQGRVTGDGGHVWAIISTARGKLHAECIQLTSCRVGNLDKLYGRGTFCQRTDHPEKTNVNGLMPLDTHRYVTVCIVYGATSTSIPTAGGYLASDYATYLENRSKDYVFQRQHSTDLHAAIDRLRVTPSPAVINSLLNRSPHSHRVVYGSSLPVSSLAAGKHGFGNVHMCNSSSCVSPSAANAYAPMQ